MKLLSPCKKGFLDASSIVTLSNPCTLIQVTNIYILGSDCYSLFCPSLYYFREVWNSLRKPLYDGSKIKLLNIPMYTLPAIRGCWRLATVMTVVSDGVRDS